MEVLIDLDSDSPPFAQLVAQVRSAVQDGLLRPRDALPSIRQLANDLRLNHNTIAKAYRRLEKELIIETKGYRGTFVHPNAEANCRIDPGAVAEERLAEIVGELRGSGLNDSEIRAAFGRAMKGAHSQGAAL